MNETIKWTGLSDKDKVKLILVHVYDCFIYEDEGRHEEIRSTQAHDLGFHWPLAWWDKGIDFWLVSDGIRDPDIFDLSSIADAWEVVEHITKLPATLEESKQQRATRLMLWWEKANQWSMSAEEAAEAICVVALRICGYEVET